VLIASTTACGRNSSTDSAQIGVDVTTVKLIGKSYFWTNIQCNDNVSGVIDFEGGILRGKIVNVALCAMHQNSKLKLQAASGREIKIDVPIDMPLEQNTGHLSLQGEGGFRKSGAAVLSLPNERLLNYSGDTVIAEGTLKLGISQQLPSGVGRGDLVFDGASTLDLNGHSASVNRLLGVGTVTNSADGTTAELAIGDDGASQVLGKMTFGAGVSLNKVGAGTLVASCALPPAVTVSAGTLQLVERQSFSMYRFKVDKTCGSGANAMQISEFQLLDGETDVTKCDHFVSVARSSQGTASPGAEGADKAVDGSVDTKWLDFNGAASSAYPDECYLVLTYSTPIAVTAYRWASANDCYDTANALCRSPKNFRLQGSNDGGTTWRDLDVRMNYAAVSTSKTWVPTAFDCAVLDASATRFRVLPGATLELPAATAVGGVENCGGAVRYAGDYVKTSVGVETRDAKTTWTGDTVVRSGTLKLLDKAVATRSVTNQYWRFAIKEICGKGNATATVMQLSELSLFGADGVRLPMTMTDGGANKDVRNLAAGEVTYAKPTGCNWSEAESPLKLFDGDEKTKFCLTGFAGDATNAATWMTVAWRMPAESAAVAGYLFRTANDTASKVYNGAWRNPKEWTLQSSADGVHWTTVDEKRDVSSLVANYTWYNGGTPWGFTALDGAFALGQTSGAKFFRWTVRKLVGTDSAKVFQLSELGLFAADGSRVNAGLSLATFGYDGSVVTGKVVAVTPGKLCVESTGGGSLANCAYANLVDGSLDTKLCMTGIVPSPSDPATQLVVSMRLADDAPPVVAYNMATANDTQFYYLRNPLSWTLESSHDGQTWTMVADVTDGSSVLTTANKTWFNSGAAMRCVPAATVLSADSTVEVAAGATFDATELASKIAKLRISLADGAGTILGFDPQTGGLLDLTDVPSDLRSMDLPIVLSSVDRADEAIRTWAVSVDGEVDANLSLIITPEGKLHLRCRGLGMIMIVR